MALSNITFNRVGGGLGRPLSGEDHVSGLVAYFTDGNLPTGFGTSDRIKRILSITQAEDLGIIEGSAQHDVLWYHIDSYFKANNKGILYVGLYDSAAIDYSVIETVQQFADGKIRQIGVFDETAFALATLTTLQVSVTALELANTPLEVLYAGDFTGVTLASALDCRSLTAKGVSAVIGEDGNGAGAALAVSSSKSVTSLGLTLGTLSAAKVNENIGWGGKFNAVQGTEYDVPAIADGTLVKNISSTLLSDLQDKGYIFLRKFTGKDGSFHNDSCTSISVSSDFAYIENNRTINKAVRDIYVFTLDRLNSPVTVNADGQLSEDFIAAIKNDADRALEQMEVNQEVSAFEILIDPTQDVLSSSQVEIALNIVPVGVLRQLVVNIGLKLSLQN